ncbi:hypothetical protein BD414DRAFT_375803, partial [Trametes punicea]
PHLTLELRECIVRWSAQRISASNIAQLAGCSERTVYEILHLHREYGSVHNLLARPRGRPRALHTTDINYLTALLQANPTLYLDELQGQLWEARGV